MKKVVWDRLGIAFSSACVFHCVVVAFLPVIFPLAYKYAHATWIHYLIAPTILLTSPLAFIPGYRKHGLTWIISCAGAGLLLIVLGLLMEEKVSDQISHGISIIGSLFLVFAHLKNLQHSGRHQHCCQ
jgi:hypothetical protein